MTVTIGTTSVTGSSMSIPRFGMCALAMSGVLKKKRSAFNAC
jgi:hypothetical protein